ncbi:MAG: hypothetical protein K2W96_27815, partial [Gemmataceae bacterium]|nr:hypothetical protein [Gemmataceae bacterium]
MLIIAAMLGLAAAPPAKLTPGQARLKERCREARAEARRLAKEGKAREAREAMARADALLEAVDGPLALRVALRWTQAARACDEREEWEAGAASRAKAAAALDRLLGRGHHRAVDLEW